MNTVKQPTAAPTNKLTAATIGAALVAVGKAVAENYAPGWSDPDLWLNLSPIVVFLCGYFLVKDKPNVILDPDEWRK